MLSCGRVGGPFTVECSTGHGDPTTARNMAGAHGRRRMHVCGLSRGTCLATISSASDAAAPLNAEENPWPTAASHDRIRLNWLSARDATTSNCLAWRIGTWEECGCIW